jgi:intergrase/recombinase
VTQNRAHSDSQDTYIPDDGSVRPKHVAVRRDVYETENYLAFKMVIRRGADKSVAFPISPSGGFQHEQKNFSWMG